MILDGKCPTGSLADKWDKHRQDLKLVNPANKENSRLSSSAPASPVPPPQQLLANSDTTWKRSAIRTVHAEPTPLQLRVGSTRLKIIQTTATVFIAFSSTPSRVVISGLAKPMSTGWHKSVTPSSTSALPRGYLLPATTPATWITAPLAAHRFPAPSLHAARPDSSYCWGPIKPCPAR